MRNVSNKYIETMRTRRDFYAIAEITFADGVQKALNKEDFILSGNSITESAESSSFPLGILAAKRITISLMNDDDRWSSYAFYGARIFLQTKFDLDDGTTETLNIGTFTVITPENYGTTISITAMDDSYKTDIPYSTSLAFPVSAGEALRESCGKCGISLRTTSFPNDNYVINTAPKDITHRQFIGMVAMIAGGNAVFDEYNRLMIKPYDFSEFETMSGEYGGIFDNLSEERYLTGDNTNGGVFEPWDVGDVEDPVFSDLDRVHFLYDFEPGITVESDDVVITGVQITSTDENNNEVVHSFGKDGYVLSLENQLADGKENEAIRLIGQSIVGLRFRPFSGNHIAYPMAEFMDLAYLVDRLGRAYQTVLTDVNFNYYGFTSLKCSADSPIRNSSKYYSNETRAIVEARYMFEREKTDRERAIEELAKELSQSGGLFMTTEPQADGSSIYYMHDKPSREESTVIWKLTANAFAISTDGGRSYPYGIDVTGMAILDRIYTVGIDAAYIITGLLKSTNYAYESGNFAKTGFMLDLVNGLIRSRQFSIDGNGNAYFGGEINALKGRIANWEIQTNSLKYEDDTGFMQLNSNSKSIVSQSGTNKVVLTSGRLDFIDVSENSWNGKICLRITPAYLGQNIPGIIFYNETPMKYIGFGNSAATGLAVNSAYTINFGANPSGITQRNIFYDGVFVYDGGVTVAEGGVSTKEIIAYGGTLKIDSGYCELAGRFVCNNMDSTALRVPIGTDNVYSINYIEMRSGGISVSGWNGDYHYQVSSSDIRLKKNICKAKANALNIIKQIPMYEFDWKDTDEHQALGFVADELEKIDPKFAIGGGYNDNGNMDIKSVDVFYLTGYIVKGMQEMMDIINEKNKKISDLEARIEKLEMLIGGDR